MIEKMLEKFEELKVNDVCMGILCSECEKRYGKNCDKAQQSLTIDKCKEIVQEESKNGGWIPCSERLPEAHKNVLVCENDGEIHLCRYNANMKRFFYDGSDWDIKLSEVIAWQPLSAPYQKGE